MNEVTRKEAKERGLKFYFTGKPCKRGHVCERYVCNHQCLKCTENQGKDYYENNKDIVLERQRKHYDENKVRILQRNREYHHETKDYQSERSKRYYLENKECVLLRNKKFREENPEHCSEIQRKSHQKNKHKYTKRIRQYYIENRGRLLAKTAKRRRDNREAFNEWQREYLKRPNVKAATAIRVCLRRTIEDKNAPSYEMIGYTPEDLRCHIESLFEEGMSWENHGIDGWHIDHIVPVSHYIKEGETDPTIINALSNLRPLWASDNLSKGSKLIADDQEDDDC